MSNAPTIMLRIAFPQDVAVFLGAQSQAVETARELTEV